MTGAAFSRDRLQPALLDRLIDDTPGSDAEDPQSRSLTRVRLRQIVLRDLTWLLNATSGMTDHDARRYPLARRSVINYGLPALSGLLASNVELYDLEQMMRRAILDFEPRILPDSLVVRGSAPEDVLGHHNVLAFEVSGRLWAQPYPIELLLRTRVDLETGMVEVRDA